MPDPSEAAARVAKTRSPTLENSWGPPVSDISAPGACHADLAADRWLGNDLKRPVVVTLRRWVVPNIGRQLILERCIHGVAEQFQRRIRPEGNSALHDQPLLVVHDDLQALELVAIHGPHPAQEGGALIELKLGCIGTGTTRRARLSENRRDDFTPLDRPYQDRAVEYDVFGKQLAHLGGCRRYRIPVVCVKDAL